MFKSKKTQEAHRRGTSKGGKARVCKGFAYMKIHDPERLRKISAEGGRKGKRGAKDETTQ